MSRDAELQVILKLERKAEEIQSANPGWTFERCYGEALLQNPGLYAAYTQAREAGKKRGERPIIRQRGGRA